MTCLLNILFLSQTTKFWGIWKQSHSPHVASGEWVGQRWSRLGVHNSNLTAGQKKGLICFDPFKGGGSFFTDVNKQNAWNFGLCGPNLKFPRETICPWAECCARIDNTGNARAISELKTRNLSFEVKFSIKIRTVINKMCPNFLTSTESWTWHLKCRFSVNYMNLRRGISVDDLGKDAYFEWEYFKNGYFVSGRTSKTAAKSISNLVDGYFEFNFENGSFKN